MSSVYLIVKLILVSSTKDDTYLHCVVLNVRYKYEEQYGSKHNPWGHSFEQWDIFVPKL